MTMLTFKEIIINTITDLAPYFLTWYCGYVIGIEVEKRYR